MRPSTALTNKRLTLITTLLTAGGAARRVIGSPPPAPPLRGRMMAAPARAATPGAGVAKPPGTLRLLLTGDVMLG